MQYADPTLLRCYYFGNGIYMSSIQQGIQAGHALQNMHSAYRHVQGPATDILWEWNDIGQTAILLNGGDCDSLNLIYEVLEIVAPKLELPFAKFHESKGALNGAITNVCVVVPEEIYNLDTTALTRPTMWTSTGFGEDTPINPPILFGVYGPKEALEFLKSHNNMSQNVYASILSIVLRSRGLAH